MAEKPVDLPPRDSRWYRTDFQVASPMGGFKLPGADLLTAEGRATAAARYVALIKEAGIEVFAVTDHNSTAMLEEVRTAARTAGLVMFPGMELSTGTGSDGVHLLLLGDPDADIQQLTNDWMRAADFSEDHPAFNDQGQHLPSHRSMIDILDSLPEDTLAIAPHMLTENGVASGDSIKESSIKWRCLHHDRLGAVDVGAPSGEHEGGFNSKYRARELDNFPAVHRMAYVSTSDAYSPEQLERHTWVRMHKPDLASLRQALLDHEARVFCDWDTRLAGPSRRSPPRTTHLALYMGLRISPGSDAPEERFPPNPLEHTPKMSANQQSGDFRWQNVRCGSFSSLTRTSNPSARSSHSTTFGRSSGRLMKTTPTYISQAPWRCLVAPGTHLAVPALADRSHF